MQQRICQRVFGGGLSITWNLRTVKTRWRTAEVVGQPATLLDVSVAGASIVTAADPSLRPGQRIRIEHGGRRGTVWLCWVGPAAEPGQMLCGVEFAELDPGLRDSLLGVVSAHRPRVAEDVWNRAV